jgi:uncharacterized protein YehS (DUF1456 family)
MKVVKTSMQKEYPITSRGEIMYPKANDIILEDKIREYLDVTQNQPFEVAVKILAELRSFAKENYVVKIYHNKNIDKGIADFTDLEYFANLDKIIYDNKGNENFKKAKMEKFNHNSIAFSYSKTNAILVKALLRQLGYDAANMDDVFTSVQKKQGKVRLITYQKKVALFDEEIDGMWANEYFDTDQDAASFANQNNIVLEETRTENGNTLIVSNKRNFILSPDGKVLYSKWVLMKQDEAIKAFKMAERSGNDFDIQERLNEVKIFSKNNFAILIRRDSREKPFDGIVDYSALEITDAREALFEATAKPKNKLFRKVPLKGNVNSFEHYFRHDVERAGYIGENLERAGFSVIYTSDKQVKAEPNNAKAQAQRIRVLALKYEYGNQSEKNDLSGTLESQAFFIDSDGDFCISESGLSDFMKDRFGLATDLNVINNRFLNINIKNIGGSISVKSFSEIEKYFSDLEKRFEISTFVDTNKYQITIDSVLDIGLYN